MKHILPILLIAAFFRFWNLAGVPPAASMDESSIGWNAYSVSKIGVDEFGEFPLISQRGYDDWRRSTYLLLTTPFISAFGLQAVSIRLPSVLLSIAVVYVVYRIVILLFDKKTKQAQYVAIFTAILFSVSPWQIYLSRIGHETNVYESFALLGLLFFLLGVRNKKWFLVSMLSFFISIIGYYAGQVFIPLFGSGLILLYRKKLSEALHDKKFLILFILVAGICLIGVGLTFTGSAMSRFGGTSTFKPDAHYEEYTKRMERYTNAVSTGDRIGRIRNSAYLFPIEVFVRSYMSHFSMRWLFFNSGNEPFKTPNMGFLYVWQLPFIFIGLLFFLRTKDLDRKSKVVILLWMLFSPLPGSIATGAPHAMRTYPSVFTWQFFTAFGLVSLIVRMGKKQLFGIYGGMILIGIGSVQFIHNYFLDFPKQQSASFHYALSKVIPYVLANEQKYEKIVFSNERNLYQSYMLFLYYSRFDPQKYQLFGGTKSGGYATSHEFGKYEFRPITKNEMLQEQTLYIGNATDFGIMKPIAEFKNLDGTIAVVAVAL